MIRSSWEMLLRSHKPKILQTSPRVTAKSRNLPRSAVTDSTAVRSIPEALAFQQALTFQQALKILRRNEDVGTNHSRPAGGKILRAAEREPHSGDRADRSQDCS